ncbi:hypothetical protein GW777_03905 [Candidatus Peregrinibacteria bacterium]|nr:hypothetical protein [Candidatus Peregrinibacteria bacterium]
MSIFDLSNASPWAKWFLIVFFVSLHIIISWFGFMMLKGDVLIGLLVLFGGNFFLARDNLPLLLDLIYKTKTEYKQDYKDLKSIPHDSPLVRSLLFATILTILIFIASLF